MRLAGTSVAKVLPPVLTRLKRLPPAITQAVALVGAWMLTRTGSSPRSASDALAGDTLDESTTSGPVSAKLGGGGSTRTGTTSVALSGPLCATSTYCAAVGGGTARKPRKVPFAATGTGVPLIVSVA